jgi:hypothetical protein
MIISNVGCPTHGKHCAVELKVKIKSKNTHLASLDIVGSLLEKLMKITRSSTKNKI